MINIVVLTGRLTKDVEVKQINDKAAVANFNIANETGFGDKKKVSFFTCKAWNATANYLAKYSKKGDLIAIDGELEQRTYEASDGHLVSVVEINCRSVDLLSRKGTSTDNVQEQQNYGDTGNNCQQPKQEYTRQQTNTYEPKNGFADDGRDLFNHNSMDRHNNQNVVDLKDDDLPF